MYRIIIVVLLLSSGAYCAGRWAEQTAESYERIAANLPPKDAAVPPPPPPGTKLPLVDHLEQNPFSHRNENGELVNRNPERRAKGEAAVGYRRLSHAAYTVAAVIPVLAVILLVFRAMHIAAMRRRMQMIEAENTTDQTSEEPCEPR